MGIIWRLCLRFQNIAAILALSIAPQAANAAEHDAQAWLLTSVKLRINDEFTGAIEGFARVSDDASRVSVSQARASLQY